MQPEREDMNKDLGACPGSRADASSPQAVSTEGFDPAREEALAACEGFINQVLIRREVEEMIDGSASWQRLKRTPVHAITSVGDLPAGEFAVDIDSAGDGWVRITHDGPRETTVRYVAGIAASYDDLPEPLKVGIDRLTAHLASDQHGEPPAAVSALWRPYRRLRLS